MGSSVLGPGFFMMARIQMPLLSIADCGDPIGRDAKTKEIFFCTVRPSLSKSKIILYGSSLVTVSFDLDLHLRVSLQQGRIFLKTLCIPGTDIVFIKIKMNIF